ncbi:MAG: hypothetical protein OEO83_00755 [Alphaproteobacteria bacterium]|nr:hypothetical protein [Alphaproteobacteria bacterium]
MPFDESLEVRSVASIRAAVADALRKCGNKEFQTIERIEDYSCNNDVANLQTAGTVFAAIADALEDTGVFGDYSTVGEVIKKLIGQDQQNKTKWIAHHIGCSCLGLATGETVAEKILTLDLAGRPRYVPG